MGLRKWCLSLFSMMYKITYMTSYVRQINITCSLSKAFCVNLVAVLFSCACCILLLELMVWAIRSFYLFSSLILIQDSCALSWFLRTWKDTNVFKKKRFAFQCCKLAIHAHNINCREVAWSKVEPSFNCKFAGKMARRFTIQSWAAKFREFSVISFMWNMPSLLTIWSPPIFSSLPVVKEWSSHIDYCTILLTSFL